VSTALARTSRARRRRDTPTALLMLGPSLLLFALFIFYPLGRTVFLGLYQKGFGGFSDGARKWVGWSQYKDVLTSRDFRHSLWVTVQYALLTVPIGIALGIGLAVLADKTVRGIGFFRTVYSSTVATSVAVASLMWLVLLNPSIGVLTNLLPFDSLKTPGLLQRPGTALLAVSMTTVWQNIGFTFIVISAGLQSIPQDLYESARIDGASAWRQFREVTLPLLGPTLLFVSVVLVTGAFQSFGQIDLLTGGGPKGRTRTIAYYLYGANSPINGNDGVQAATAVILFVLIAAVSLFQFRSLDKRVQYGR
jgi:sn-glycerol 3-phosphate transport system permease protein